MAIRGEIPQRIDDEKVEESADEENDRRRHKMPKNVGRATEKEDSLIPTPMIVKIRGGRAPMRANTVR